ncbi:PBP GOBP domain containing protein, partial [Asbolus verrucosus]
IKALTDEQKEKLNKVGKECREQSGVSQELVDKLRNGEYVEDAKLKAQMLCVSKKLGLADDSGNINVETLKTKVKKVVDNDAEVDEIVEKCAVKRDTPEDTAFFTFKCLRENKPKFSPVD